MKYSTFYSPPWLKHYYWNHNASPVYHGPKENSKPRLPMRMTGPLSISLKMWRRIYQPSSLESASVRTMNRRRILGNSYNPFACDLYSLGLRVVENE